VYVGILAAYGTTPVDLSHLRICMAGASPFSEDLLTNWEKTIGCPIYEGVGMSEGAPYANNPVVGKRKVLSVGLPPPETEVEVVDLDTGSRVMPAFERGEIRVRGPQMIESYRNRPDETARTIRDGWIYTGDVGYFDDEGYMFVVDRKKELIISGGYNIYPREVEEVLFECPKIKEAAVIGVPDPYRGETVKAFVVLRDGVAANKKTAEEIINFCRERMASYKVPRQVVFRDSLPKSGVGKYLRRELRNL
jgi:long-chain acyl-CoA synthetase